MQERLRSFFTRQFSNPSGLVGKFIGNRMAKGNVYDSQWTISLLGIQPHHRVLEIGFGPGISTQMAGEKASKGLVAGSDLTQMFSEAGYQSLRVEVPHQQDKIFLECIPGVK